MASAHPGPAAGPISSPPRSHGLAAGSGYFSPLGPATGPSDLVVVARELCAPAAARADLRDRSDRTWVLLAATERYEAWAIGWPPGSEIGLHDHGEASGVLAVAAGTLTETTVGVGRRGTVVIGARPIGAGRHRPFGPGHVHHLSNDGDTDAVSVHVYGPRLSTMRYYELDGRGRLRVIRSDPVASVSSP